MEAHSILPDPRLRSFVDFYRYVVLDTANPTATDHLCVPIAKRIIAIYLNGSIQITRSDNLVTPANGAVVVGQHFKPVRMNHNQCPRMFCIVFNAAGLYRLLRLPLQEFDNSCIPIEAIFGSEAEAFTERLENLSSPEDLKRHTDLFLLSKLDKLVPELPLDRLLQAMSPGQTVTKLAESANMSLRQFERVCQQRLGMSPKQQLRLRRFCTAYEMREQYPQKAWLDITFLCGYYDQMHFIKDWKYFTDSPPAFLKNEIYEVAPLRKFSF